MISATTPMPYAWLDVGWLIIPQGPPLVLIKLGQGGSVASSGAKSPPPAFGTTDIFGSFDAPFDWPSRSVRSGTPLDSSGSWSNREALGDEGKGPRHHYGLQAPAVLWAVREKPQGQLWHPRPVVGHGLTNMDPIIFASGGGLGTVATVSQARRQDRGDPRTLPRSTIQ